MKGRKRRDSMLWTTSLVLPIIQKFRKFLNCCYEIWIQLRIDLSHYLPQENNMEIDFIADENFPYFYWFYRTVQCAEDHFCQLFVQNNVLRCKE